MSRRRKKIRNIQLHGREQPVRSPDGDYSHLDTPAFALAKELIERQQVSLFELLKVEPDICKHMVSMMSPAVLIMLMNELADMEGSIKANIARGDNIADFVVGFDRLGYTDEEFLLRCADLHTTLILQCGSTMQIGHYLLSQNNKDLDSDISRMTHMFAMDYADLCLHKQSQEEGFKDG